MHARAKDSDSDNEDNAQTTNYAGEEGLSRLQEIDLGIIRADRIKADDRKQKYKDRANVKLLLESRDACKAGTKADALYNKNKSPFNFQQNNIQINMRKRYSRTASIPFDLP